jgi:transcriptional regulator with XRE-family HTH domain
LGTAAPEFWAAEAAERDAESLCAKVRKDLRDKRKSLRVEQATIAKKMDLSQSAISKIENGKGDIGLKTLYRYANALGQRPLFLFIPTHITSREESDQTHISERQADSAAIVSAQDMFLRRMSEMVPELMAHKSKIG